MVEGVPYDFWFTIFSVTRSVSALIYHLSIFADVAVESVFGIWNLGGNVWRRTGLFCVKNYFRCDGDCMGVCKFHVFVVAQK